MKELTIKRFITFITVVCSLTYVIIPANAGRRYHIYIGNTEITSDNNHDVFGDGKVNYDPEKNILSLKDYTYEGTKGIMSEDELSVLLTGENTVSVTGKETTAVIKANKSVSFIGDGTLTLTQKDTLTTDFYGVYCQGAIDMQADIKINLNDADNSIGIYAENGISADSCKIEIHTGTADNQGYGMQSKNLELYNSQLQITVSDAADYASALYVKENILLNQSNINLSVKDADKRSVGLECGGNLTISGGKTICQSGKADESCGFDCAGNFTTDNGAAIELTSGEAVYYTKAVQVQGITSIKNTVLSVTAKKAFMQYGIFAGKTLTVEENSLITTAIEESNAVSAQGIYSDGTLNIRDSKIKVQTGNAGDYICGIYTGQSADFDNATVSVVCGQAINTKGTGTGIYSGKSLAFGNCELIIHTNGTGIDCEQTTMENMQKSVISGKIAFLHLPEFKNENEYFRINAYQDENNLLFSDISAKASVEIFQSPEIVIEKVYPVVYGLGDINTDAMVNAADARLALRTSVGLEILSVAQFCAADMDTNGRVDAADARIILRITVNLENLTDYNAKEYYFTSEEMY